MSDFPSREQAAIDSVDEIRSSHPNETAASPGTPVTHPNKSADLPGTPVTHPNETAVSPGTPRTVISDEVFDETMAVRATGLVNMFDARAVQRIANDNGYFALVLFIEEHLKAYGIFILTGQREV